MSKLSEYHIQLDANLLLKNTIEFNSWIDSILKNIEVLSLEEFQVYKSFYLRDLVKILYAKHYGKLQSSVSLQEKLSLKLFRLKKINRLSQLKELFLKLQISASEKIQFYIDQLVLDKDKLIESVDVSANAAILNPEVYLQYENNRKELCEKIALLDPLVFIENLFKVIPVIFESSEYRKLIYNYVSNSADAELIVATNSFFEDDEKYPAIKSEYKELGAHQVNQFNIDTHTPNTVDHLGEIASLREKLVDGCGSKQEYVNTLFEIAINYKKIGMLDRSYFFAVMVNRLIPDYRNVGALLK